MVSKVLLTAVVKLKSSVGECTGVAVGENTVLTSSVCLRQDVTAQIIQGAEEFFTDVFECYPLGSSDGLCVVKLIGKKKLSSYYSLVGANLTVNTPVLISGYGSTNRNTPSNKNITFGEANIKNLIKQEFSTVGNAFNFGDCGAPALTSSKNGALGVVGVGCRGDLAGTSYFIDLTDSENTKNLKDAAKKISADICGLTTNC